jgi:hypothetical protein
LLFFLKIGEICVKSENKITLSCFLKLYQTLIILNDT